MKNKLNEMIIAIDGPVGSGKSTVARRVAELLGYAHLDSGAMYRAVAWKALRDRVPLDSPKRLAALAESARIDLTPRERKLRVILDGDDGTELIRTPEVSPAASIGAGRPRRRVAEGGDGGRRERERKMSPLVRAADAVIIDNSAMDAEETARAIVMLVGEKAKAVTAD